MNDQLRAAGLRFETLGPLTVSHDDIPIDLGPPRQRALLAILLIHVGRVVPLPTIITAIWGADPPRRVMGTLQAYVSRLRKLLRRHDRSVQLVHRLNGYLLDAEPQLVDAAVFEAQVRDCREALKSGDLTAARALAWSALELWNGKPMGELYEYEFAVMEADRLEQVRLRALDVWAQACLGTGAYEEVAVRLGEELRLNPALERLGGRLMRAQYHSGQPAEALQTYERMRTAVAEELGVDLSRELRVLHGEILRQELAASPVADAEVPTPPAPETAVTPPPPAPNPPSAPVPPGEPQSFRLVGRGAELERLAGLMEEVRGGSGHVVLVFGEQGIGKTQLLRKVTRCLVPAEARVVRSYSIYAPSTPPYWTWEQVLRQVGSGDGGRALTPADATARAAWRPEQHFAHQIRICQAVLSAADEAPLVLILEDLHAADVPALEVLHVLAKQICHAPVLVLATLRDHELAKDAAMRRMVGRILQESTARTLRLKGLTRGESRELIASVRGVTPSPEEARELQHASNGNPFLLLSLLSAQTTSGYGEQRTIPFEVREVLHERLSTCSPDTREVLTLCAVIGTEVRRPLLAEVLSARGLPQTLVNDALQTGLLRTDPTAENQLSFTHGLVRELLVEDAQPLTRAQWHRDVADVLAAQFRPEDDTAQIRRHCLESARVLGTHVGVRPLVALADRAQERFFHAQALHRLEDAASVIAELPRDETTLADELHLRKRMMWLRAQLEGYSSPRVADAFGQAQLLERAVDNTQPTELMHTRAIMALAAGEYALAAETGGLLYELAEHGGGQEARAAACYTEGVTLHVSGRTQEALATLNRGMDIIDGLLGTSDGPSRSSALLNDQRIDYRAYLALTHWINDDRDQAQHYRAELLQLTQSDRYDRPWDRAFARYVDALIAVSEGDVEGAWRAGRAGVDLAARCQLAYWHRMLAVPLGWAEVHQGTTETGLNRIRRALCEAAQHRTLLRRTLHLGLLGDALRHVGRADEARLALRCAAEEIEKRGEHAYARPQWPYAALLGEHTGGSPADRSTADASPVLR